jgi:PST family polysaccharide transporter
MHQKKILNNQFFRVFSYNSIIISGKIITSFVVSKISAIYLGPSGFALVGNFKNVLQGILGITSSGFQSGVIKHIAESQNKPSALKSIISSVCVLSLGVSVLLAPFLFIFSEELSDYVLLETSYAYVFKYLAFFLPVISLNFLLLYIINGFQKLKLFTIISTIFNVFNAILTFLFIYIYDLSGALMVSLFVPVISLVSSALFKEIRVLVFEQLFEFRKISINIIKSVSVYLVMAMYSTVLISITYLLIRHRIINTINIESAGLWEAMNKISTFYMLFFSSLFTLYLLPKLSQNNSMKGYKNIMIDYFKFILPLIVILFSIVFMFRTLIIKFFLTDDFLEIKDFFYLQLIGDFIKIIAFSFAYQFHAKKIIIPYFISDAILYVSFGFASYYLIDTFKLTGVYYAYICSLILYILTVIFSIYFTNHKYLQINAEEI